MGQDAGKGQKGGRAGGALYAVFDAVWPFALAIGVALLLRVFVVELFVVPTGSMLNTIQLGDVMLVEKVSLHLDAPRAGEVVTFRNPANESETLVKRVIATEGQTVDLVDGQVLVDGVALDEPYTEGRPSYPLEPQMPGVEFSYPFTVPEGCVWAMGDNRTNSRDSRYYGPVRVDEVFGRARVILWPLEDAGSL